MIFPKAKTNNNKLNQQADELAANYPALLSQAKRISGNVIHGAHGRRKRGSGETFWEFRRARDEDPASSIDWRRSGRSDALFVRETEWEAANTVFLWRDSLAQMNWRSDPSLPLKRDRAAVLLAALGIALLKGSERCMVPGVSLKPGTGIAAMARIAHEIITGTSLADTIVMGSSRNHAHLVIASDFLEGTEIWQKRFARISQTGISVILLHISDPAEELFPFSGRVKFFGTTEVNQIDLGRAQLAKTTYQQRFMAGREQIKTLANKNGWLFLNHRTDQHPANVFLALYQGLGGQ